jgi:hypothetical protein
MDPQRAREEDLVSRHTVYNDDGTVKQQKRQSPPKEVSKQPAANDAVYQQRRVSTDRSDLIGPDHTRKVRSLAVAKNVAGGVDQMTTDEAFRKEVSSRGVRPEYRGGKPADNLKPEPSGVRGVKSEYKEPKPVKQQRVVREKRRKKRKKRNIVQKTSAKIRVTAANLMLVPPIFFLWSAFQIPIAVLNIVSFGIIFGWDLLTRVKSGDSSLIKLGKGGLQLLESGIKSASSFVKSLFGLDPSILSPANLWILTEVIILGYALLMVLFTYLLYKLFFLNPLSGRAAGLKMGVLILIFFGYFTPILNLLPWILIWTSVVWFRPK